ncbi:MAG TPA: ROK family protein [Steroidobacteraceae bacterium]|nr:ROK family protein [Steroidobacteraceae bacterium]
MLENPPAEELMPGQARLFGAVEAGGTKFVCAIADESGAIHAESRFPTADPDTTLARVRDFFKSRCAAGALHAIGVACFGPVILQRQAANYGFIGKTPKVGWSNTDVAAMLAREFSCPVGFDTDVNAAALAEHRWGAGRDTPNLVYVTVGTGIGAGVLIQGAALHGLMHPKIGHIHTRRHELDADFAGVCPFHGDCLEGLASGPAILARTGAELQHLDAAHVQWQIEADYLGQLCAQLVLTLSPQRIIMGGGVMAESLFPLVRRRTLHWLGGYVDRREILDDIEGYILAPALGGRAGVLGALCLAALAREGEHAQGPVAFRP